MAANKSESVSHSVMSNSLWPHDCNPPGCSVHGILQARILEWLAIPFSRGSSWPKDLTQVSSVAWPALSTINSLPWKKTFKDTTVLWRRPIQVISECWSLTQFKTSPFLSSEASTGQEIISMSVFTASPQCFYRSSFGSRLLWPLQDLLKAGEMQRPYLIRTSVIWYQDSLCIKEQNIYFFSDGQTCFFSQLRVAGSSESSSLVWASLNMQT